MKKILEVYVFVPDKRFDIQHSVAFASEEALIDWWKDNYDDGAKHLRLRQWSHSNRYNLLKWNTSQLDHTQMIFKTTVMI